MHFLKPSQEVDATSFRIIFFGVHKHFLADSYTAKASSLMVFFKNSSYKITESIDAFFKRLLVKAKRVNTIHGHTAVSETMIWTIFFQSIKDVMGDRHDSIIDTYLKHRPLLCKTSWTQSSEEFCVYVPSCSKVTRWLRQRSSDGRERGDDSSHYSLDDVPDGEIEETDGGELSYSTEEEQ